MSATKRLISVNLAFHYLFAFMNTRAHARERSEFEHFLHFQARITDWSTSSEGAANGLAFACATLELFADLLAREAGNLALKSMCTSGIFLSGGVMHHLAPIIDRARFCRLFAEKGDWRTSQRFSNLCRQSSYASIRGAAALAGRIEV